MYSRGLMVNQMTNKIKLKKLYEKLMPIKTEHDLIRLGSGNDGGYLIPDDLSDISVCFSPGVSNYAYFEEDLFSKYKIKSHLADYSVDGPPETCKPLSFTKKFISSYNSDQYMTMEKWVKGTWEYDLHKDMLLQMDIEGGEYESILSMPDTLLKRFRIVVIEIHHLENWGHPLLYKIANAFMEKLLEHFLIVHVHPNNYAEIINVNGLLVTPVVEVTLHRKDRCNIFLENNDIPNKLDAPCNPKMPEIILPNTFYKNFTSIEAY